MKYLDRKAAGGVLAALLIAGGIILLIQQRKIADIKARERRLAAQFRELSANYAALLAISDAKDADIARLRKEAEDMLRSRNQLAQSRKPEVEVAALQSENERLNKEISNEFSGYLTRDHLRFSGFSSPEDAFQSMTWARINTSYDKWLASLAPRFQEEELANPKSREEFQRTSALHESRTKGMQILAKKAVGDDRVELKVRFDSENSVAIFVIPMVAIGNEWKPGDDFHAYTEAWDR